LERVALLSARNSTPFAGRHGVGGSFRYGAVRHAPGLLDRMSKSDCGLVGVRKSARCGLRSWAINLRERPLARGLQEGEIKQELQSGGHLRNVLIITKTIEGTAAHLAYVRPNWRREFLPLRTWGDKEDRTYKDLDRLLVLLRDDFGYRGFIGLYMDGDSDLARIAHAPKTKELARRRNACPSSSMIRASPHPSSPTSSMIRMARATP
jgi:hypothetical protein